VGSSLAALITAIATLIASVGGFIAVLRGQKQVRTSVNGTQRHVERRSEQLVQALQAAGIKIPPVPEDPPPGAPAASEGGGHG
jgi:hypothetical protein